MSTTDQDATVMSTGREKAALGFHNHYVIDGGKARIILNALVTPADVMENAPMLPLLRRAIFRWRVKPEQVIGDMTYGTAENIRKIEESGIRVYTPLPDFDARTPYLGKGAFQYDPERDIYRCPQGEILYRHTATYTEGKVTYRAQAMACNACPIKAQCTAASRGG